MTAARARLLAAACLAAALCVPAPAARAQCAMCRAAVERSEEGRAVAAELNQAILLMFLAPYAVFGTCASVLFRRRIAAFVGRRLRPPFGARALVSERAPLS